jgi:predicted metal-dependent hydrolase
MFTRLPRIKSRIAEGPERRQNGESINVQFEFNFNPFRRAPAENQPVLAIGGKMVPLNLVRNDRARRYILRVGAKGILRVTIPRRGSFAEARRFAEANRDWIERQLERLGQRVDRPSRLIIGGEILLRGETVKIEALDDGVRCGTEIIPCDPANLRAAIEKHFWRLAVAELGPRVFLFASQHGLSVNRVTVRSQRSRWGSCSRKGTISLNWRLIQAPAFVQDYLILHELMHLRQMNHSDRFWREVESVCPDYRRAERWLKEHGRALISER